MSTTMRVVVALFFILAISKAFVPSKFSPALLKAIKGNGHVVKWKLRRMRLSI